MMKKTFLLALFACVFLLGQGRANAQETKGQLPFILRVEALGFVEPFAECSGMGSQNPIIERRVTNANGGAIVEKLPGQLKLYEITCSRLVTSRSSLWSWRRLIEVGNFNSAQRNGEIILTDLRGAEIARWVFNNGWPASLKISDKDLREELVLAVEDLERVR